MFLTTVNNVGRTTLFNAVVLQAPNFWPCRKYGTPVWGHLTSCYRASDVNIARKIPACTDFAIPLLDIA